MQDALDFSDYSVQYKVDTEYCSEKYSYTINVDRV